MTTTSALTGLHPPLATPMHNGAIDFDSLERELEHLSPYVHGVLYGGSISETTSLSVSERISVIERVAATLGPDRVSVSIADNSLVNRAMIAEAAMAVGVQLLVLSCPNYYTNDLSMLVDYFTAVAELTPGTDLCLYDNPYTSHTWLSPADIIALVRAVPQITHAKVTDRALEKVATLTREADLTVLSGDDLILWHHLNNGAAGLMTALPLIFPSRCAELWQAWIGGDRPRAKRHFDEMAAYCNAALSADDYPYFIKASMHHQGVLPSDEVRPPLRRITSHRLADALELV
jgi:4-hydroxy-tetrahydrodipicolinate synthase